MTRLVRGLWLVGIWLILWWDLSLANIASGVLVAGAIVAAFDGWRAGTVVIRPLPAAHFAVTFVVNLVRASFTVARTVLTPSGRVHTGIVAVPLGDHSDAVVTVIADAVNLTPGTLTIEIRPDPPTLYLHALDVRDADRLRREVLRVERLAVRAFEAAPDQAASGR